MDQEKSKTLKRCEHSSEYFIHWEPGPMRLQLRGANRTQMEKALPWPQQLHRAGPWERLWSGIGPPHWPGSLEADLSEGCSPLRKKRAAP